ncbi:MAG: 3-dehydroquinate synthase family protein [Planctomycetota bacterium]
MTESRTVRVALPASGERGYEVRVGPGVSHVGLSWLEQILGARPGRAFVVLDSGLPAESAAALVSKVRASADEVHTASVEPSERTKSLETLSDLLSRMVEARLERTDPVIAVGGGIVGDVAGFAAASYRRGVPVIQCPTTLLSMVDASVGGKTGINVEIGGGRLVKNMAGAFWQPAIVLADVSTLSSLSDRVLRCGLAECLKHGLLGGSIDPTLWSWTREALPNILAKDEATLTELVSRNVAVKAAVVGGDEREMSPAGGRALLNLGHTYAHAIEPMGHLSPTGDSSLAPLQHGEAVALGVVAAAHAAAAMGLVDADFAEHTRETVAMAGLPTRVAGLPDDADLFEAMLDDKKVSGGTLRLIVPDGPGSCRVVSGPERSSVMAGWAAIRDEVR